MAALASWRSAVSASAARSRRQLISKQSACATPGAAEATARSWRAEAPRTASAAGSAEATSEGTETGAAAGAAPPPQKEETVQSARAGCAGGAGGRGRRLRGEEKRRDRGTRCPSVVKSREPPCVLTKFWSSKSRKRYFSVSARKKEGMWSSCVPFCTEESAAKPAGTRIRLSIDATISAPIAMYLASQPSPSAASPGPGLPRNASSPPLVRSHACAPPCLCSPASARVALCNA
mmetsp:Transcript_10880/g.36046  ORF Transcript_10880/g.36046 Transcript_10880/m.36046 type:complete len:234 (-) Transcript_10880:1328-2029(-)|eukprot:scaffold27440_cov124-Isochrysis_galbana.AAC.1